MFLWFNIQPSFIFIDHSGIFKIQDDIEVSVAFSISNTHEISEKLSAMYSTYAHDHI